MSTVMKTSPVLETESLSDLAEKIMQQVGYDKHKAETILLRKVRSSPHLTNEAIEIGVWDALRKVIHVDRHAANGGGANVGAGKDDTSGLARMSHWTLMEYPLSDGTKLGDATKEMIEKDAAWHETLAQKNSTKGRWLRAIQRRLRTGQLVRDILTANDLQKLLDQAEAK